MAVGFPAELDRREEILLIPVPPEAEWTALCNDLRMFSGYHKVQIEPQEHVGGCDARVIHVITAKTRLSQPAKEELVALLSHHKAIPAGRKIARADLARLVVDSSFGAGVHLEWYWDGYAVAALDPVPGQEELACGHTVLAIQGCSLRFASKEGCVQTFGDLITDGAHLAVAPPGSASLWETRMFVPGPIAQALHIGAKEFGLCSDLCSFSSRHGVPVCTPSMEESSKEGLTIAIIGGDILTPTARVELDALLAHHLRRAAKSVPKSAATTVSRAPKEQITKFATDPTQLPRRPTDLKKSVSAPLGGAAPEIRMSSTLRPTMSVGLHVGMPASPIRSVRLRFNQQGRAGLELVWEGESGFRVADIEKSPGQPGLRVGDYLVAVAERPLRGLDTEEEAEHILAAEFVDGVVVNVTSDGGRELGPEQHGAEAKSVSCVSDAVASEIIGTWQGEDSTGTFQRHVIERDTCGELVVRSRMHDRSGNERTVRLWQRPNGDVVWGRGDIVLDLSSLDGPTLIWWHRAGQTWEWSQENDEPHRPVKEEREILAALHEALSARDVEALELALSEACIAGVKAMSVGFAESTLRELKLERNRIEACASSDSHAFDENLPHRKDWDCASVSYYPDTVAHRHDRSGDGKGHQSRGCDVSNRKYFGKGGENRRRDE